MLFSRFEPQRLPYHPGPSGVIGGKFTVSLKCNQPSIGGHPLSNLLAMRGTFFDFVDDPWKHVGNEQESARFHPDGLLVLEHGKIKDFGAYADIGSKYAGVETTHIKDRLILPGF